MDDEEKQNPDLPQEQHDDSSPFDNTGQVTGQAKKVGKKAVGALRGLGTASETAEATDVATQAAEKTATKVASRVAQSALRTAGSSLGGWAVVIVIGVVFIMTILIAILGGAQTTTGTSVQPTPPPIQDPNIPGLTYTITAPSRVGNGEIYTYTVTGSYTPPDDGASLETFTMRLMAPGDIISLVSIPGKYTTSRSDNTGIITYTWKVSENLSLFKQEPGTDPPVYTFQFEATSVPIKNDTIASVEFVMYENSQLPVGDGERCTVGSTNTCGEKYNISKNPDGLNFGDPNCELTTGETINKQMVKDEIMRQLQAYNRTKDYCRWSCIARHEGGYNPNSYNGNATRAHGAWGMFQMSPWACYTLDKPYNYNRTGNVSWREQIKRAMDLQYKNLVPWQTGVPTNSYWSTYKHTCYKEPDWTTGTTCIYAD